MCVRFSLVMYCIKKVLTESVSELIAIMLRIILFGIVIPSYCFVPALGYIIHITDVDFDSADILNHGCACGIDYQK